MTKRMLHENITKSEKFSKISFEAECLYNRLLTQTDDNGNTLGSYGYIKDICFPRSKNYKSISYTQAEKWTKELIKIGLLISYSNDDVLYLHFSRFEDFQKLRQDRLKKSSIPCYDSLRSNGCQLVAECPHEVEVKVEVEVEDKGEGVFVEIINNLNDVCSTNYKSSTEKTQSLINARLKEGFTVDDFKTVINKQNANWSNDAKFSKFLRPETLFGTKFEGYLNAKSDIDRKQSLKDLWSEEGEIIDVV